MPDPIFCAYRCDLDLGLATSTVANAVSASSCAYREVHPNTMTNGLETTARTFTVRRCPWPEVPELLIPPNDSACELVPNGDEL
jgi:hypothetical protein